MKRFLGMSQWNSSLDFAAQHLGGRPEPDDLRRLLDLQASDAASGRTNALREAGVTFLDSDRPPELVEAACRGRDDLEGIARLARAQAMADMVRLCGFVAEDVDGEGIGYWFGPEQAPIEAAPLIRFNRNGSFSIEPGNGIAEAALVIGSRGDEGTFATLRNWLNDQGIVVSARSISDIRQRECSPGPQVAYEQLIQAYSSDLTTTSASGIGDPVQLMTSHRGPKIS
jgi:hypothetical protein